MTSVEPPLNAEVEMTDPLVLRIALNLGFFVAVGLSLAFWVAVVAAAYELV
jgi:hypothetical protein